MQIADEAGHLVSVPESDSPRDVRTAPLAGLRYLNLGANPLEGLSLQLHPSVPELHLGLVGVPIIGSTCEAVSRT